MSCTPSESGESGGPDECDSAEWIDLGRFSRLIAAAVDQTGDPAFGLHWGERTPFTNFGIVAAIAHWSPSPRTALAALTRFQGLLFRGQAVATFQARGHTASLRFELSWLPRDVQRAWAEFVVVGTWELLKQLCGRHGATAVIMFDHAAPAHVHEYRRILGSNIAFERSWCGLELDTSQLDLALPQFNERLSEAVMFEANCALARLEVKSSCRARVHEQLAAAWPHVPTMDAMARRLGISGRTLRRRLEQEQTSFPALVADALRNRALQLLGDPQASVKQVAYALGFATPNAFYRAFKRWTGSTPSEVRSSRA
jgi:AraC-like DNA-binding protein